MTVLIAHLQEIGLLSQFLVFPQFILQPRRFFLKYPAHEFLNSTCLSFEIFVNTLLYSFPHRDKGDDAEESETRKEYGDVPCGKL
jgi:hypothetical protein